jgi:hypothetical protein
MVARGKLVRKSYVIDQGHGDYVVDAAVLCTTVDFLTGFTAEMSWQRMFDLPASSFL